MHRSDYHSFLNEARLSALAIAIYFAGLKSSPAANCRLLLLDDILIGLDMAHRENVVRIIGEHFKDWQIVILTYSKAWFERLKEQIKPLWTEPWKSIVLREKWIDGEKSPYIVAEGSGDMLEMAERHLIRKDYKAAAVYARSALEAICNRICAKAHLRVMHVNDLKKRKVEHFLVELRSRLTELVDSARRAEADNLFAALDQARSFVLNRNAHFDVEDEDTLSAEVDAAIGVVKNFNDFLTEQAWEKENFQSGLEITALEKMSAQLGAARALTAKGAKRQCQGALRSAHDFFWHAYGERLGVLIPIGAKLTALHMWKAAEAQGKLQADVKLRLNAAKGYLYGSVKANQFDVAKFEEAAQLLEELISAPEAHQ